MAMVFPSSPTVGQLYPATATPGYPQYRWNGTAWISVMVTVPVAPANITIPSITGIANVGSTLTVTPGTWSGFPVPTLTYQWLRGATAIAGATGTTYAPVTADVGSNISVTETATNPSGTASATSTSVGPVTGLSPSAPTLAWASTALDNTPNFTVGLKTAPADGSQTQVGDVLHIQRQPSGGTWTTPTDYLSHTIAAGDLTASSITIAGITAVPDGSYGFRARIERSGTTPSAWTTPDVAVTIDTTAPTASTYSPASGATNVAINASLILTFSEPVAFGTTVSVIIKKVSDNSNVFSFTSADEGGALTIAGSALTIKPPTNFANSLAYWVTITSGSITDIAGNPYAGISAEGTWNFTTTAAVTYEPETQAWINAVGADSTAPFTAISTAQKTAVNNLVLGLKADFSLATGSLTLKTIFDAIWLFCIADSGGNAWTETRYDIVNQHTWTMNTGSSAAFTSRWTHTAGYTGVVSDSNFLNTGIILSSFGGAYTINSCHLMAMISNARTTAATKISLGAYDAGTHEVAIAPYNSVSLCGWDLNESLHPAISYPSSQGLWVANRLGSTQSDLWQNGVWSGTSSTGNTTAVPSANTLLIGGQGGNGASFSDDTIQAASFGAGLPGNLSGGGTTGPGLPWRINQYMQAVGAAWHF